MKNSWSDSDAATSATRQTPAVSQDLAILTYATQLAGREPDLCMYGGGNSSCKGTVVNALGEPVEALFVKGSGVDLANIAAEDFVAIDLAYARRLVSLARLSDESMADEFACHQVRPSGRNASVETLLHATLKAKFVLHTHPAAILALTNREDGERVVAAALGRSVVLVPYARAGLELARAVNEAIASRSDATAIVLSQHGLVTWGETAGEAYQRTIALVTEAESYLGQSRTPSIAAQSSTPEVEQAKARYRTLAPILRGALGPRDPNRIEERLLLDASSDPDVLAILSDPRAGKAIALTPPLTPDYLVRTRRLPLWIDDPCPDEPSRFREAVSSAVQGYRAEYRTYLEAHGAPLLHDGSPRALLLPGIGLVTAGRTAAEARMVLDITRQGLLVKRSIHQAGARYVGLGEDHLFDMESRAYQKAKIASRPLALRGSVAIVTGAAGAIGSGICEHLLAEGCHVAATDLGGPALEALGRGLAERYPTSALVLPMDVTSAESVSQAFAEISSRFGGIDLVIVNAGVAHVAPLSELSLEAFRRLERVNVEGTLLVLAEAGRLFGRQGTGGDIVLISTKNVFAPGAGFGAYSATKAASHQLARIASLELAPLGVRVNMVAPDAVFSHGEKRSGLWAEVGPNRMKARGLDERGLEEYYRSRNLLKAAVTADHVARAVLFFATRQTPTTGATLPVDGGLPDATPR